MMVSAPIMSFRIIRGAVLLAVAPLGNVKIGLKKSENDVKEFLEFLPLQTTGPIYRPTRTELVLGLGQRRRLGVAWYG